MNIFQSLMSKKLPFKQDFIWLGEYYDKTFISEFDFKTRKPNSFYDIDRKKLINFGLIGTGYSFYFNVVGGQFYIQNTPISFSVEINNKEYPLTIENRAYRDIITYKDAESILDISKHQRSGTGKTNITQFNVGYKINIKTPEAKIHFQPILKIPYNNPVYFELKLTSDKNVDGVLNVYKNGKKVSNTSMNMKENISGHVNWVVK